MSTSEGTPGRPTARGSRGMISPSQPVGESLEDNPGLRRLIWRSVVFNRHFPASDGFGDLLLLDDDMAARKR